jgi:hypothetical protein
MQAGHPPGKPTERLHRQHLPRLLGRFRLGGARFAKRALLNVGEDALELVEAVVGDDQLTGALAA